MSAALDTKFDAAVEALGSSAITVKGGAGELFMEIMNPADRNIWIRCEPVTEDQYKAVTPDQPFIKSGCAAAAMDRAAFAHSPETPGQLLSMECDGLVFHQNARTGDMIPSDIPDGPMRITVHKHHLIGFEAGSELVVMDLDGEHFIEVIGMSDGDEELVLPENASLRTITLEEPIVVMLPEPTTAFFWMGDSIRSFQGPVDLPDAGRPTIIT